MLFRRQSFILVRWKYKSNKPHFCSAAFCHCNNAQVVVTCCKQYVLFWGHKKRLFVSSVLNYNNLHVLNSELLSVWFMLRNPSFFYLSMWLSKSSWVRRKSVVCKRTSLFFPTMTGFLELTNNSVLLCDHHPPKAIKQKNLRAKIRKLFTRILFINSLELA